MKKLGLFLFFVLILSSTSASAFFGSWQVYELDNIQVFFPKGYEYQAQELLYYMDKHYDEVMKLTGNKEGPKVHVVLEDLGLRNGGWADPRTYQIRIYVNQPSTLDSYSYGYESWYRMLGVHELTHIGHMTNDSKLSFSLPQVPFGNLFGPNISSPLWISEGIAMYAETRQNRYEGNLNTGYYDALIASQIQNGSFPSLGELTYDSRNQYPLEYWYLYGGSFFNYLAKEYGEEKFAQFFDEYSSYYWAIHVGNFFPIVGIDKAARKIYEKDFSELFKEWEKYERERYKDWGIEGQEVVPSEGGGVHALTQANDKIYYLQERILNYSLNAGRSTLLVEYDPQNGKERVIRNISFGMHSSSIQVIGDNIYYSRLVQQRGYPNSDYRGRATINRLHVYNLETNREKEIMRDEFEDFVLLESGEIIYVKDSKSQFGSEVWRYYNNEREKIGRANQLISELQAYGDRLVVVSKRQLGTWNINYLDLKEMRLEPIIETEAIVKRAKVIEDKLYFTSNYDHLYSIYSYDLQSEALERLTFEGYASEGLILQNELYFVTLDGKGNKIYKNKAKGVEYTLPADKKVKEIDIKIEGLEAKRAGFKNLSYLSKPYLDSIPYILPFEDNRMVLRGSDAIGLSGYKLSTGDFENLDFKIYSAVAPIKFRFDSNNDFRYSNLNLHYPIHNSLDYGMTWLAVESNTYFGDDWEVSRSPLDIDAEFAFKRPTLSNLEFNYNTDINSDRQTNSSRVSTNMDFALWEEGLSSVGVNYFNRFEGYSNLGVDFDFLLKQHKVVVGFDELFDEQISRNEVSYEYLMDKGKIEFFGEMENRDEIIDDQIIRCSSRRDGGITYEYWLDRNKKISTTKSISQRGNDYNKQYRRTIRSEMNYNQIINRNHRLNLGGSLGIIENKYRDDDIRELGYETRIDYQHRLLELRRGLWNPNIFLADIYGRASLSYNGNYSTEGYKRGDVVSYGYTLIAEGGFGNHFKMIPELSFKVSDKEKEVYFGIDISPILDI